LLIRRRWILDLLPEASLFFVRPVNFERVFPGLIIVLVFVRLFSF
jgi:hypothetical protein